MTPEEAKQLSTEEQKAIKALERAMNKMPNTLLIFGGSGFMSIRKGGESLQYEVAYIRGNVTGGDGGDTF